MFNNIIINKDNLINNIKQVKSNNPNSKICAMVKANAYGVGQKQAVQILNDYVDYFGVACFFEAKKLKPLTHKKILIVGALDKEIDSSFSYACHSIEDVDYLIKKNIKINIHLKVNSGMNRFGFKSVKEFILALNKISNSKLNLEGVFTHFATDDLYVNKQFRVFKKFLRVLKKYDFTPIIHADNSSVQEKINHNLDMVRIGFNLFNKDDDKYKSVVEIKSQATQITKVKKGELVGYNYRCVAKTNMRVATIPLGYADGIDLRYIGLKLNVKGRDCEILNVCMDCFLLDVSNIEIKKGDDVYILNKQNPLNLYAKYLGISEYQVLTNFSHARAKRLISSSN